jgi:small-conductance mechanosensitive channel
MIWVAFKSQLEFLKSQSEAIIAIKKAFDKEDIMIPFPIRTLDFGIKGGEKLNEVLPQIEMQSKLGERSQRNSSS